MNKVFLIGTIDKNPELRFTQAGQAVLNMKVETKEEWIKDGAKKERKEWTSVVLWGKRAEELASVLAHGVCVVIEGRLQTSSYDDKDGKKVYKTEVNASGVELFGNVAQGSSAATPTPPREDIPFGHRPKVEDYGDISF